MSKNSTYKVTSRDDCKINITYSNGIIKGGEVLAYKFFNNCRTVRVLVGDEYITLHYDQFVGIESLAEWKALFTCSPLEEVLQKVFEGTYWYTDNTEDVLEKEKTPIAIDRWLTEDSTEWCYVLTGEIPAIDGSNLITNINDYTMLGDFNLGNAVINEPVCVCALIQYAAPAGGGAVSKSRADLLADTVAKLGITAPTGQKWELQTSKVAVYSKGTDVTDFGTQAETTTTLNADADVTCGGKKTTVNANGGQIPFGNDPMDLDCNGESDNLLPADYKVEFDEGSAIATYNCVTLVAA